MGNLAETVAGIVLVRHNGINSEEHTVSPEQWERRGELREVCIWESWTQ